MTLYGTQYWYPVIWLFAFGAFFSLFKHEREELVIGQKRKRWDYLPAIIFVVPLILWTGYRSNGFGDTGVYNTLYNNMPSSLSELNSYLGNETKDLGFTAVSIAIKSVFGDSFTIYLFLIAIFQLVIITFVYRKYSSDYFMSMLLFILSTDYFAWTHNGMRQFVAATAVLACFGLIVKKKYIPAILIILLFSTIHLSLLIMIPIIFIIQGKAWNTRTLLMILATGAIIAFLNPFLGTLDSMLQETQYNDILTNEVWINDDGTNALRVLVYSVPAIISLIGKKYIDKADDPVVNISVNASICTAVIYILSAFTSGIYVGRLTIYTTMIGNYICLPWLIEHVFEVKSARLVKIMMLVGYLGFFYYQMHFAWGVF